MIRVLINRIIYFIVIVFFAFLLISCCRDDNYYDLSMEELSLLPYEIDDTIVLKNSQNDTITFFCKNRTKEYYCFSPPSAESPDSAV